MLSQEQKDFFHANGYLVVENAVTPEQLDHLRQDLHHGLKKAAKKMGLGAKLLTVNLDLMLK